MVQPLCDENKEKKDFVDYGVIDRQCGQKKAIHGYFNSFMKEAYYDRDADCLSFEDFYMMSEQFFDVKGLPVLFRDILYNLMGYFYAVSDRTEDSVNFYSRLIRENLNCQKTKELHQFYAEQGINAENIEIAGFIYDQDYY